MAALPQGSPAFGVTVGSGGSSLRISSTLSMGPWAQATLARFWAGVHRSLRSENLSVLARSQVGHLSNVATYSIAALRRHRDSDTLSPRPFRAPQRDLAGAPRSLPTCARRGLRKGESCHGHA